MDEANLGLPHVYYSASAHAVPHLYSLLWRLQQGCGGIEPIEHALKRPTLLHGHWRERRHQVSQDSPLQGGA